MSTPNPALQAAAPALMAMVQAVQQFIADMGQDPAKWLLNYPGAKLKLVGSIGLQLPQLATAEAGALETVINNQLSAWEQALAALSKPA